MGIYAEDNNDSNSQALLLKYKNYHLWMLIPFAIAVLGFSFGYYLNLANATFHQHVHGISATLWYILVIVQPYLITRRHNFQRHRTLGTIGIVLAGIVAGSALTIIPRNINNVEELAANDFFNPTFAYFATLVDVWLISMFIVSVLLAILNIKRSNLSGHIQWMMASVFFVLSPALLRMLGIAAFFIYQGDLEGITMVQLAAPTTVVMIVLIAFYYYKFGSFKHPSFALLVLSHLLFLSIETVGNNEGFRKLVTVIFKM